MLLLRPARFKRLEVKLKLLLRFASRGRKEVLPLLIPCCCRVDISIAGVCVEIELVFLACVGPVFLTPRLSMSERKLLDMARVRLWEDTCSAASSIWVK